MVDKDDNDSKKPADDEELDEARFTAWVKQAAALPGERM